MKLLRGAIREQAIEILSQAVPPGDTFVACIECQKTADPAHRNIKGPIGLVVLLREKLYFFTLTDRNLVVNRANRFTNRPGKVMFTLPLESARIGPITKRTVGTREHFGRLLFQFPQKDRPTLLYFHKSWDDDIEHFMGIAKRCGGFTMGWGSE